MGLHAFLRETVAQLAPRDESRDIDTALRRDVIERIHDPRSIRRASMQRFIGDALPLVAERIGGQPDPADEAHRATLIRRSLVALEEQEKQRR